MVLKHKASGWKISAAILVVAIIIWYFAYGTPAANPVKQALGVKTPLEKTGEAFEKQYGKNFITFTDPDYGFSVKHPVGYNVVAGIGDDARVIISATSVEGFTEAITVGVTNETFGSKEFNELVALYEPEYVKAAKETSIGGRQAFYLSVEGPDEFTGENSFMHQATVTGCRAPGGSEYAAIVTAIVPEPIAAELAVADYMIASFKC